MTTAIAHQRNSIVSTVTMLVALAAVVIAVIALTTVHTTSTPSAPKPAVVTSPGTARTTSAFDCRGHRAGSMC